MRSHSGRSKKWAQANPERVLGHHLKQYGLSLFAYESLIARAGGRCEICGYKPGPKEHRLHIDHNARINVVRGLLCRNCNLGVGHFVDSAQLLRAAARYLERAENGEESA